jgi:hypothetical protein
MDDFLKTSDAGTTDLGGLMVIRHVLIKPAGGRKFVVEPVHENGDVTLFLVPCRVVCGKFIGGRNQKASDSNS